MKINEVKAVYRELHKTLSGSSWKPYLRPTY